MAMKQATNTKTVKFTEEKPTDFSNKLRERLEKIVEACHEAAEEGRLELEVDIEKIDSTDHTYVAITSTTHYHNKGELGSDYFHIVLGERGGVHKARKSNHLTDRTLKLAYRQKAFQKLLSRIERMT